MDPLTADIGTVDLADYAARFRRRWWAVALGLVLGVTAGYGLTQVQSPRFDSSASVLVLSTPQAATTTTTGRTPGEINLDTEAQLVRSAQVARAVEDLLGGTPTAAELRRSVTVSVPPNSQVLTIQYTAPTAEGARAAADGYAEAYLQQRQSTVEDSAVTAIQALSRQQDDLRTQLEELNATAASLPEDSPNLPTLDAQRTIVISQIGDLSSRISALQSSAGSPGRVITEASLPDGPSFPVLAVNLGAGALAGLLLGLALAFLADKSDHRVRRAQDVRRSAGLPLLAQLQVRPGRPLDVAEQFGHQFDLLRNAITRSDRSPRIFQVAELENDPLGGEPTAVALAQSLSRASHDVVLVLAQPSAVLSERLGLLHAPGLSELLREEHASIEPSRHPALGDVRVIAPGSSPEDLEGLLQSAALPPLLDGLKQAGTTVVVVSGAPDRSAAAQAVSFASDACVLVVGQGTTDLRRLPLAASELRGLGADPVGVVLVRRDRRRPPRAGTSPEAERGDPNDPFPTLLTQTGGGDPPAPSPKGTAESDATEPDRPGPQAGGRPRREHEAVRATVVAPTATDR